MQVNSLPQGADCRLPREGTPLTEVRAPQSVTVPRSVHNIDVHCRLPEGRASKCVLQTTLTPMVAGYILVGGLIGAGVDAASGATNEYPNSITVNLPERGASTRPKPAKKKIVPDPYGSKRKPVS